MVARDITLPVDPDEAWEALTDPELLEQWFGDGEREAVRRGGRARRAPRLLVVGGGRAGIARRAAPRRRCRRHPRERARGARRAVRAGVTQPDVFAALADPTRRTVMREVSTRGSATATELALPAGRDAPGGGQAPRRPRRRGPGRRAPRGPRDALPPHPRPARRGDLVDDVGRRRVGRAPGRAGAPGRAPARARREAARRGPRGLRPAPRRPARRPPRPLCRRAGPARGRGPGAAAPAARRARRRPARRPGARRAPRGRAS